MFFQEEEVIGISRHGVVMIFKKVVAKISVLALLAFSGYGQEKPQKPEWVNGFVVAYDAIKADTPCYGECERSLIIRLEAEKQEKPRYIRVDIKIQEGDNFPGALIANKRLWRFKVVRTSGLDEPIYDYIVQNANASAEQKKYPIWKLIPGAEGENLPLGEKISSYSMNKNDFKAISN
ncbi:MAG TPA: hypothetical protein VEV42_16795 [Pyrinomonadaceae bacterium]|nr:hypothetical protein [Pyrinomonadaceae bacterium]